MAVKFPLEMKDGFKARNISELKDHFDIEKVVGYFLDGKLKNWLDARYYDEESEAIDALKEDDPSLPEKLCDVFGIPYSEDLGLDPEAIARKNERTAKLKQFTSDCEVIEQIDCVAFDQEELADLYDKNVQKIILCEGEFKIPKNKRDLDYVLIGSPNVKGLVSNEETVTNTTTECNTTQSLGYMDVAISEELFVGSSESKEFYNSIIDINNHIICEGGKLKFGNCVIRFNPAGDMLDWADFAIKCQDSIIEFEKCKFSYEQIDAMASNIKKSFLKGNRSIIKFNDCTITGMESFLAETKDCEISFTSCRCENVTSSFMYLYDAAGLKIEKCDFISKFTQYTIEDKYHLPYGIIIKSDEFLITMNCGALTISESSFNGFGMGLIKHYDEKGSVIISQCDFTECRYTVESFVPTEITKCNFEKCIFPISGEDVCLSECIFTDCFGKLKAKQLYCYACVFTKGALILETKNSGFGKLANCTFENIDLVNVAICLNEKQKKFFKHFSFATEEAADNLIYYYVVMGIMAYNTEAFVIFERGEINDCKFVNINAGKKQYVISGKDILSINKSIAHNCIVKESVLDRHRNGKGMSCTYKIQDSKGF